MRDQPNVVEGPGFRMERHGRFIHQRVDRTAEEHRALLEHLAASVDDQVAELARAVEKLEARLATVDTFTVLGALSLVNHLIDPETYEEVSHSGKSFVAEYAALLALKRPYGAGTTLYANGQLLQELQDEIEGVYQSVTMLQLAREARRRVAAAPDGGDLPKLDDLEELQMAMRTHELTVRNMAYPHHHRAVLEGLFVPIEATLLQAVGFGVADALRLIDVLVERTSVRFHDRFVLAREQSAAMAREVDRARRKRTRPTFLDELARAPDQDTRERLEFVHELSRRSAAQTERYFAFASAEWTILDAADICAFTAQDLADASAVPLERAAAFVRAFSLEFGAVPADFVEPSQTHPLRTRPLIHHDGRYLCPAPMLLDWAIQPCFEQALKAAGTGPWEAYQRNRHDYLLETSIALLRRMMPRATFATNLFYDVIGARVQGAHKAELDALGTCDTMAFFVEAKGMPVTDAARRGAPDRLRRDLRQLIGDPHAQAARARAETQRSHGRGEPARFRPGDGGADVELAPGGAIRETILMAVTLAPIGHLTAQLAADSDTGLFEWGQYSWVVNLYDLMVIADLVDPGAMFPHYVTRRVHAARLGLLEASDELDIFSYYLTDGLYLDDVAEARARTGEGPDVIRLLSHTGPFDAHYAYVTGERETPAPKPAQTIPPDLRALLERLDAAGLPGWLEASLALLDLGGDARATLARMIERARRISRAEDRPSNASMGGRGDGGWGVTYWCAPTAPAIGAALAAYCERKRREVGAERWIGVGEVVGGASADRRVVAVVHDLAPNASARSTRPHRRGTPECGTPEAEPEPAS